MVSICNINLFQNSTAEGVVVPSRYASQQYQMYLVLVSVCDLYTVKLVIMNSNSLYLVDCLGIFYKNLLFFQNIGEPTSGPKFEEGVLSIMYTNGEENTNCAVPKAKMQTVIKFVCKESSMV